MKYATDIRPHFHQWATEGFARYEHTKAAQAALQLTQGLLDYKPTADYSYQLTVQRVMQGLKDNGITARDVLIRMTELAGYMESRPGTFRTPRAEAFAVARLVIHLVPHVMRAQTYSPHVLGCLGELAQEACYPFAFALARKMTADGDERASLRRLSADLGAT